MPEKPPSEGRRTLRLELTAATMLKVVAVVGFVWLLLQLWPILLVVAVALMLVGALGPPISFITPAAMAQVLR
jgi:hypothetical protein